MKPTDETLSAFLDSELSPAEMSAVRDQIADDPTLADRLAELATVDAELRAHYSSIDDPPMPEAVSRMLANESQGATPGGRDNVIAFPWWRRLREHSGKAVAAAVIAGFAMTQWLTMPTEGNPPWPAVAEILDSQPSGQAYAVNDDAVLTPRLTFMSQAGEWCRQFHLDAGGQASEQIACRTQTGSWEQRVRKEADQAAATGGYQTASGGSLLDRQLDQLMADLPLGREAERQLLEQRWSDR
ncbi:hypothetical protein [Marinobacter sp. F3R08]|uniref:hypothetical protein n=1 Tax=Marinobacter sp. F3R08 TaxID=2841559 RepID=UPI001C09204E|nr:hypothetical protein [Marinobacter sp. F3R08]MBU2952629.1 hypothetical protein [Marinobacter sp. F3R08]